jgi:hypothetical protein
MPRPNGFKYHAQKQASKLDERSAKFRRGIENLFRFGGRRFSWSPPQALPAMLIFEAFFRNPLDHRNWPP